jgi:GNAT superfamily N-acetyltransferase
MSYSIRQATPVDYGALAAIERAAAAMFRDSPHPQMADAPLACEHLATHDHVWVVVDTPGNPVGFAIVRPMTDAWHLQELDVHPAHARRGLGARLIAAIADAARTRGLPALTLSTTSDIPWNAPYYERLGFRSLAAQELTADLLEVQRLESAAGLPLHARVCMRKTL